MIPLAGSGGSALGGTNRTGGFALYVTPGGEDRLGRVIAHEHTHTWIPFRTGRMPTKDETGVYWFSEGFTDFFMNRTLLRAGLEPPQTTVARMDEALRAYDASPFRTAPGSRIVADVWSDPVLRKLPYQRGALLALKWDEEIRRKSGGKLDMDDVILRMADHYRRFPAGQGPDVVTGLVSAAWVTAGLDLRPDIARYADGGAVVPLPETMFDGCLDARITVSPGFDAGFDATGSFAAKVVRGVRRGGPAWNSGLRNGMALESWVFNAGDMTREIVLAVRATGKRARPRTIRFWPYGDVDVETRRLQMAVGLSETASAACARKIGGL